MPKISIIIPVYNVEKYIEECLNSILNQTIKDIEIIGIDDGSSDNSLNIIQILMLILNIYHMGLMEYSSGLVKKMKINGSVVFVEKENH